MHTKKIAVDFDGTLCENKFPSIGRPNWKVINELLAEQQAGSKIILWTCRAGEDLKNALEWCKNHNIEFDAVNENMPDIIEAFAVNSRKIYADEYWDDRAVVKRFNAEDMSDYGCQVDC